MSIQSEVIRLYKAGVKKMPSLAELQARQSIAEVRGEASFTSASSSQNSQLKSPLTEVSRTTTPVMIDVPENATQVEIEVITSLTMKDARGYDYVFNFTPPA